jgi:hypothetical protein
MTANQTLLLDVITKALKEKDVTEFKYLWEWVYVHPTQSISIKEEMIHSDYPLPTDYSLDDLETLAELGYIEKHIEIKKGEPFHEIEISYKLKGYVS